MLGLPSLSELSARRGGRSIRGMRKLSSTASGKTIGHDLRADPGKAWPCYTPRPTRAAPSGRPGRTGSPTMINALPLLAIATHLAGADWAVIGLYFGVLGAVAWW